MKKQLTSNVDFYGEYTIRVVDENGKVKSCQVIKNKVPTAIRAMVAENMFNASPSDGILISHVAVGSGTTAAADGDTTLETETARVAVTSRAHSGGEGTCSAVFGAGVATGTHREVGIFAEATLTADSGILSSRTSVNITVAALDSLFIDWKLTLSDA